MSVLAAVEQFEIFECLLLLAYQHTCDEFFVFHCLGLQAVWHHIVNVLDEDDVGIEVVQVFNQRAVTSWAEENLAVFASEWRIVWIGSHCVRTCFLF